MAFHSKIILVLCRQPFQLLHNNFKQKYVFQMSWVLGNIPEYFYKTKFPPFWQKNKLNKKRKTTTKPIKNSIKQRTVHVDLWIRLNAVWQHESHCTCTARDLLSIHLPALTCGSPVWVHIDPDGLKLNKITFIQNIIQKRQKNAGALIVQKSTSLFLIHLNDIFVLHPQLSTRHRREMVVKKKLEWCW